MILFSKKSVRYLAAQIFQAPASPKINPDFGSFLEDSMSQARHDKPPKPLPDDGFYAKVGTSLLYKTSEFLENSEV